MIMYVNSSIHNNSLQKCFNYYRFHYSNGLSVHNKPGVTSVNARPAL